MWVADMDFASPPCVTEALRQRIAQEVFGYSIAVDELNQAVVQWAASHYEWEIHTDWIVWLPGIVPGLHVACLAFTAAGAEVLDVRAGLPALSFLPVGHRSDARDHAAPVRPRWLGLDLDALADAATPNARLLLLCHPHNPVGRAFHRDELAALAEVCERRDLIVCSDEIHCDLMLEPRRHVPLAKLGEPSPVAR